MSYKDQQISSKQLK